jgi:GxxExxY protein
MIHHEGTEGTKERGLVVSQAVIGAAIEVHRELGPGLLESVYEMASCRELWLRQLRVDRQVPVRVRYKGVELESQVRLDLLVESVVVVEVKSTERLTPVHRAQLLTYLKITHHPIGLLLNFNVQLLKHGIRRLLNGRGGHCGLRAFVVNTAAARPCAAPAALRSRRGAAKFRS